MRIASAKGSAHPVETVAEVWKLHRSGDEIKYSLSVFAQKNQEITFMCFFHGDLNGSELMFQCA